MLRQLPSPVICECSKTKREQDRHYERESESEIPSADHRKNPEHEDQGDKHHHERVPDEPAKATA